MSVSHQNCCFHTTLTAAYDTTSTRPFWKGKSCSSHECGVLLCYDIMSDVCWLAVFITTTRDGSWWVCSVLPLLVFDCCRLILFCRKGRAGDIKRPGGGHVVLSINTDGHDKSDAMLNAAQHVTVASACPLFFHIPHRRKKLRSVLNHHKGSLWAITSLSLFI